MAFCELRNWYDYESLLHLLIGWYKWKLTYVEDAYDKLEEIWLAKDNVIIIRWHRGQLLSRDFIV